MLTRDIRVFLSVLMAGCLTTLCWMGDPEIGTEGIKNGNALFAIFFATLLVSLRVFKKINDLA